VPPPYAADAILEALDAAVPLVICITEGIPTLDMFACGGVERVQDAADRTELSRSDLAGKCKMGIMPGNIHEPGNVGV